MPKSCTDKIIITRLGPRKDGGDTFRPLMVSSSLSLYYYVQSPIDGIWNPSLNVAYLLLAVLWLRSAGLKIFHTQLSLFGSYNIIALLLCCLSDDTRLTLVDIGRPACRPSSFFRSKQSCPPARKDILWTLVSNANPLVLPPKSSGRFMSFTRSVSARRLSSLLFSLLVIFEKHNIVASTH